MSEYDQIEKIFSGSWESDREENVEAFMTAIEASEMAKKMSSRRRTITLMREGSSLKLKTVFEPGMEFESTLKLNEVNDIKDKEENPRYHIKTLPTFKDGVIIQDVTPQKADGGKRHISKMSVQGDEMTMELSLPEGSNVTAERIYKRC